MLNRGCVTLLLCLLLSHEIVHGAEDLLDSQVARILERHCLRCHSGENPQGELNLTERKHLLTGGESGSVIIPGEPKSSLLLDMISGDSPEMPKESAPLSKEEIAAVERWIAAGAPWPAGRVLKRPRDDWWSLLPLVAPAVPRVSESGDSWCRTPIDRFVWSRLDGLGLSPSPEADRRTYIRRVTFDLHGLPPSPEEIDAFLADTQPGAYGRLVDRLLDSPRYGERWARHWLDVVHYGDTHGYDKDKRRPNAWPYRDYVIRAFNSDKPYRRFVREQLAGDVIPDGDSDGIVATGFIAAGPWDFVGHVELREGTVDKQITRVLDRDDMVMNAMSSFSSLTVHCARCHNHKFDPITQADYYSLQAVFAGIERADRKYDADKNVSETRNQLQIAQRELDNQLAELNEKVKEQAAPQLVPLEKQLAEVEAELSALPSLNGKLEQRTLGYHSVIMPTADETKWVQVDLGESREIEQILLIPAHVKYGNHPGPGFGFPPRFKVEIADTPDFDREVIVLADHTANDFPHPGNVPVGIAGNGPVTGRYVRVTATRLWERTNDFIFALSELVVLKNGNNLATDAEVTALDSIEAGESWGRRFLVDETVGLTTMAQLARQRTNSPSNGYHSGIEPKADVTKWVQIDLGESRPIDVIRLFPARPTDFADTPGFGFPVRFKMEISNDADFRTANLVSDQTQQDFANPGDVAWEVAAPAEHPWSGRYIRLTATKLWERADDYALAIAEMQVEFQGQQVGQQAAVTALDSIEAGRWSTRFLLDGFNSRRAISSDGQVYQVLADYGRLESERRQLQTARSVKLVELVDEKTRLALKSTQQRLTEIRSRLEELPPQQLVYAAAGNFPRQGNFTPPADGRPRPIHVLNRGDVKSPEELVAPGSVSCIPELPARFVLDDMNDEGARRLALANWIVDSRNPLTWRSIVNRIWHYHFGRGLVETPNDFGRMGAQPTHPELLDWLASDFRDGDQSIKQLHRLIVLSSVYRQVSAQDTDKAAIDAGNRYLWRMNRQRLEAESLRDATLAVSGDLDLTMYGPGFDLFEFEDDHSPRYLYDKYDPEDSRTLRRTVYRFIVRSVPDPFMESLDCADPSLNVPVRNTTITALQALSLLNNPFMLRQSERFAERLRKEHADAGAQVDWAFRIALGRHPTAEERKLLVSHSRKHGLANMCRLIFNMNEFLFVD